MSNVVFLPAASIWFEIWGSWIRVKKNNFFSQFYKENFKKISTFLGNFTKKRRFFKANFRKLLIFKENFLKFSIFFRQFNKKIRFSRQKLAIYSYFWAN